VFVETWPSTSFGLLCKGTAVVCHGGQHRAVLVKRYQKGSSLGSKGWHGPCRSWVEDTAVIISCVVAWRKRYWASDPDTLGAYEHVVQRAALWV